jgi:hypothetical protein
MFLKLDGNMEVTCSYRIHLGPRFEAAGLRIQFHYNQAPGVHFKIRPSEEYQSAILKGIDEGMKARFPDFPKSGSIWITEIIEDEIDSSERAFYRAGRLAIEQAFAIRQITGGRLDGSGP